MDMVTVTAVIKVIMPVIDDIILLKRRLEIFVYGVLLMNINMARLGHFLALNDASKSIENLIFEFTSTLLHLESREGVIEFKGTIILFPQPSPRNFLVLFD